jgi:hypothetical protein
LIIVWSSMFLTDTPITSGPSVVIASCVADFQSGVESRSSKRTSKPAFAVAAATHANPRGSGVITPDASRLPDMSKTRIADCLDLMDSMALQSAASNRVNFQLS